MRSYTSSSKDAGGRCVHGVLRERVLLVAGLALALGSWTLARLPPPASEEWIRSERLAALYTPACTDWIWIGDSRVQNALPLKCMAAHLPAGTRASNFAFPLARFTDSYLEAAEQLLDPRSGNRVIILGITPHALLECGWEDDWFARLRTRYWLRARLGIGSLPILRMDELAWLVRAPPAPPEVRRFDPREWDERSRRELVWFGEVFRTRQVSAAVVARVLGRVRAWSQAGIRVFALRPPTAAPMLAVEAASGFDQEAFAAALTAAGGVWIELPQTGYATIDGSHVTPEAAVELSRQVSAVLRRGHATGDPPDLAVRAAEREERTDYGG